MRSANCESSGNNNIGGKGWWAREGKTGVNTGGAQGTEEGKKRKKTKGVVCG